MALDARLAAARDKAEEMKPRPVPEPWWRRALATLRRPPVLALASVAVLLAGAIVVTRHQDTLVEDAAMSAPSAGAVGGAPAEADPSDADADAVPSAALDHVRAEGTASPAATAAPSGRTMQEAPTPSMEASTGSASGSSAPGTSPAPRRPARRPASRPAPARAAAAPAAEPASVPRADSSARGADRETAAAVPTGGQRAEPSLDALIRRCSEAAANGDCAAVRALAAEIERTDPRAYRARVITVPAVRSCLSVE